MKPYLESTKAYIIKRNEIFIGLAVVVVLGGLIAGIAIATQPNKPAIVYDPTEACSLFTAEEAEQLLGNDVLSTNNTEPLQYENVTVSSCGYAQNTLNADSMRVAAVTVRSGINDTGAAQNKTEFTKSKSSKNIEEIPDVGEQAYYSPERGQLNVLKGRDWIVLSYGIGATPAANTKEDLFKLADKVF